jgi:hypothetical protein
MNIVAEEILCNGECCDILKLEESKWCKVTRGMKRSAQ